MNVYQLASGAGIDALRKTDREGAGVVAEVGASATRFEVGDKVIPTFWPAWIVTDIGNDGIF
ncbi:hypothetical protein Jab_2c11200 [Janthinobacterium sp. HH01]|nr:hypothetical protein Jab_2c11200 [Janthinobacterium sp. HH01]